MSQFVRFLTVCVILFHMTVLICSADGDVNRAPLIVNIDEKSVAYLNSAWPFPRQLHASILATLKEANPVCIFYDVTFCDVAVFSSEDDAQLTKVLLEPGLVIFPRCSNSPSFLDSISTNVLLGCDSFGLENDLVATIKLLDRAGTCRTSAAIVAQILCGKTLAESSSLKVYPPRVEPHEVSLQALLKMDRNGRRKVVANKAAIVGINTGGQRTLIDLKGLGEVSRTKAQASAIQMILDARCEP